MRKGVGQCRTAAMVAAQGAAQGMLLAAFLEKPVKVTVRPLE